MNRHGTIQVLEQGEHGPGDREPGAVKEVMEPVSWEEVLTTDVHDVVTRLEEAALLPPGRHDTTIDPSGAGLPFRRERQFRRDLVARRLPADH